MNRPRRPLREGWFSAPGESLAIRMDPDGLDRVWFSASRLVHGWNLSGACEVLEGALVLTRIEIRPIEIRPLVKPTTTTPSLLEQLAHVEPPPEPRLDGRHLKSDLLRQVSIPNIEASVLRALAFLDARDEEAQEFIRRAEGMLTDGLTGFRPRRDAKRALRRVRGLRRGRIGYGDEFYRWVALTCLDLQELPHPEESIYESLATRAHAGECFLTTTSRSLLPPVVGSRSPARRASWLPRNLAERVTAQAPIFSSQKKEGRHGAHSQAQEWPLASRLSRSRRSSGAVSQFRNEGCRRSMARSSNCGPGPWRLRGSEGWASHSERHRGTVVRRTVTLKPSTRNSYRSLLDEHVLARWGNVELRRITHSGIAAWVADLSRLRSASTTRKALGVLRQVLGVAVADKRLAVNPAAGVAQPRLPLGEQRFLDADELARLAEAMPSERDRLLALLLGCTGVRFGEAAGLDRADVDPLRRRVRVERAVAEVRGVVHVGTPKSHGARTVALPAFLADDLGRNMGSITEANAPLFASKSGTFLRVTTWKRRVFDPAARAASLTPPPLRVHDLRHTAASLAIASGASVKLVQRQLGHRSATLTLDTYSHLFADDLDALSDALDGLRFRAAADSVRIPVAFGGVVPLRR